MPREMITLQVGQCGNQVATRFWDLALQEHTAHNTSRVYDDCLSSFFKNVDTRSEPGLHLPVGTGQGPVHSLKARAIVVDTEEGVISELLQSSLGGLFDRRSMLADTSGAGNNWAHGHHVYGPQYADQILESLRHEAEECDSLQGFMLMHSMGGGTGSGLGTYLLSLMADNYPDIFRFTVSLFPSEDDDVITSPYNAMLSLNELIEHASCVLPLENQALFDLCGVIDSKLKRGPSQAGSTLDTVARGAKPFDRVNSIAANVVLNLTSSMRYEGTLNVDMNDVTMNMVPYPRAHFLVPSMSPLSAPRDRGPSAAASHKAIDHAFTDVMSREYQLLTCDPRASTYLACGLLMRGGITISDANRNIARLKPHLKMAYWNQEGFKIGLCDKPALGSPYSLLCLSNNTCITTPISGILGRFNKLYKRQVFLHHYTEYMEASAIQDAAQNCADLVGLYSDVEQQSCPASSDAYRPRGMSFL